MTGGIRGSRRSHAFLHQVTQSLSRLSLLVEPSLFPLLFLFDFRGSHLGFCKFRRRKKRRSWAWALSPPLFFLRCQGSEGRRFLRPSLGSLFFETVDYILLIWNERTCDCSAACWGEEEEGPLLCRTGIYFHWYFFCRSWDCPRKKKTLSKKI